MRKKNALKLQFPPPWTNQITYLETGEVRKVFGGNGAQERFNHEVSVLQRLSERGCDFTPRIKSVDSKNLSFVMGHCGKKLPRAEVGWRETKDNFRRLNHYGVRHDDPSWANMLYRESDRMIVLIDFEFSTLLDA